MLRYTIIALTIMICYSCEGDTQDPTATLALFQKSKGQCGEQWGDTFLDYELGEARDAAAAMLMQQGIAIHSLTMDSLHQLYVCVTCHDCPSGWYYKLESPLEHEQTLIKLGFEKQ